ncbi:MAG TPA: nicotinate-nucleotide--dimethylbenzimidazole phosphoribosyltransferase [Pirellulales bacterium]|jgi:nicotinate-nucleotide--dimethylbenzimidazole phosphoribosyltransferase|nr:nicotinate-nucleotide--dimethylbenzimidazole phosphoribosyltransferase [Pirellulales bacterium]
MWLDELVSRIGPVDQNAATAARARQDSLTKPTGSLGRLETLVVQIAGITGRPLPQLTHKVIVTMAGDHGVVAEGVSAYPQAVTAQMVQNFLRGGAAINVLARQAGARVVVTDVGVATDLPASPNLIAKKVRRGTANIAHGPAMTSDEALAAIRVGVEVIEAELDRGLDILALGEMGIGNTTAAAAIAVVLTDREPAEMVGRGTGLDSAGVARKQAVVERALAVNRPDRDLPLDVLAKVGGLEIAALAGAALAAAAHRRPVVVDGYPSTAAAMIAAALAPALRPYLIAAHRSQEAGHQAMLAWLGLESLLDLGLRLGEGTGAALALLLIEAACRTSREMATFAEAGVSSREER